MITPGFSLTATERVLPKLALDFTTASLDPRVTFTRALNTATCVNSSGYIATVNANLPRFDYDPITLACKGLLIEESRINILTYSEFTQANWNCFQTSLMGTYAAPTGTNVAKSFSASASTGSHYAFQASSFTAGSYTLSMYAKYGTQQWLFMRLFDGATTYFASFDVKNFVTGAVTSGVTSKVTDAGNGWYRISMTATVATGVGNTMIGLNSSDSASIQSWTAAGTEATFIFGGQLEAGAFPTSYIPNLTTGTTTRNADQPLMTGTNFTSWYNASQGTISVLAMSPQSGQASTQLINISDGTSSNRMWIDRLTANDVRFIIQNGGSTVGVVGGATIANGVTFNANAAYKLDNLALCVSNGNLAFDTSSTIPTVNNITIGYGLNANYFCGYIKRILYWPMRLTDNEVKTYSKV